VVNVYLLDIVVHKDVRMSGVIVSDILDSDELPNSFSLADRIRIRNPSDLVDKFTDWERFQSLAPELILPRIQIISGGESQQSSLGLYCLYSFGIWAINKQNYTLGS
jgi:hypothetical protein